MSDRNVIAQHDARISQLAVDAAFDWLLRSAADVGAAKANKSRKEFLAKRIFAKIYLNAEGSVETRKAIATVSQEYQKAMEEYFQAEEKWEAMLEERSKCETVLDCWRTQVASDRQLRQLR